MEEQNITNNSQDKPKESKKKFWIITICSILGVGIITAFVLGAIFAPKEQDDFDKARGERIYNNLVTTLSNSFDYFGNKHEVQSIGSICHAIDGESGKTYIYSTTVLKDKTTQDVSVGTFAIQLTYADMETFIKALDVGPISFPESYFVLMGGFVKVTDYDVTTSGHDKFYEQYPYSWGRYINYGKATTGNKTVYFSGMSKNKDKHEVVSLTHAEYNTETNDFNGSGETRTIGTYEVITSERSYYYSLVSYILAYNPL